MIILSPSIVLIHLHTNKSVLSMMKCRIVCVRVYDPVGQLTMIKIFIRSAKTIVFSTYEKQRIHFPSLGLKPFTIAKELEKEKLKCLSQYL
jgi:hypothetical protein